MSKFPSHTSQTPSYVTQKTNPANPIQKITHTNPPDASPYEPHELAGDFTSPGYKRRQSDFMTNKFKYQNFLKKKQQMIEAKRQKTGSRPEASYRDKYRTGW